MDIILNMIKQLLILTIILKFTESLSVNGQYKKYVKLVCGLLLIVFILTSVTSLINEIENLIVILEKGIETSNIEMHLEMEEK